MQKCKGCEKEITWCQMKSGKKMPLDAAAVKMVRVENGIGELIDVYTPHWATCIKAGDFKCCKK